MVLFTFIFLLRNCILVLGAVKQKVAMHNVLLIDTGMGDHLQVGKLSRYVTSHLGQLSLSSHRGR